MGYVGGEFQHGSRAGYKGHGCRCEECRAWAKSRKAPRESNFKTAINEGAVEIVHGSPTAYMRHGCRCAECRGWKSRYIHQNNQDRQERIAAGDLLLAHGKARSYREGCRCEECLIAKTNPCVRPRDRAKTVSVEDIELLSAFQHQRCAICDDEIPLHLDHDHETMDIRGLLCVMCNTGLGRFRDSPARLLRAIEYLEENPAEVLFPDEVPRYSSNRKRIKNPDERGV